MKRLAVMLASLLLAAQFAVSASPSSAASPGVVGTAKAIKIVGAERVSDRVTKYKVSTPSLAMSSSVPLRVNVILPTGYAKDSKRRFPVLYALPGTSNLADVWLNNLDTVNMTRSLPMIVVIPDGTYNADGGGFYTNWVDQHTSRGVANWETFHTQELVSGPISVIEPSTTDPVARSRASRKADLARCPTQLVILRRTARRPRSPAQHRSTTTRCATRALHCWSRPS